MATNMLNLKTDSYNEAAFAHCVASRWLSVDYNIFKRTHSKVELQVIKGMCINPGKLKVIAKFSL